LQKRRAAGPIARRAARDAGTAVGRSDQAGLPVYGLLRLFCCGRSSSVRSKNVFLAPGLQFVIALCWRDMHFAPFAGWGVGQKGAMVCRGGPYYNRASHSKNGKWMPDFEIRRSEFKRFRFLDHKTFFGRRCIKKRKSGGRQIFFF